MRGRGGFTMIEIIVIVAVIAIMAGFLTPTVMKQMQKSRIAKAASEMNSILTAFNDYFADTGLWPNYNGTSTSTVDFVDFRSLYANTGSATGWDGPYLDKSILVSGVQWVAQSGTPNKGIIDPWGSLFRVSFAAPGSADGGVHGAIALICAGPNKTYDTSATNALHGEPASDDIVRVITKVIR